MTRNYNAFTLAEVLITLVIIGVIAAMTIPTLIYKTNNQEIVSRLKKTYSTLAQATNRIIAEEGNPRGDIGGWATDIDAVYNLYKKHLQISKDCGSGSGCFPNGSYKHLKNSNTKNFNTYTSGRKFVLADGASVFFSVTGFSYSCDKNDNNNDVHNACITIFVDVNGHKGPMRVARDMFEFVLKKDGLYPAGCDDSSYCAPDKEGYACTCKVLRESAINY